MSTSREQWGSTQAGIQAVVNPVETVDEYKVGEVGFAALGDRVVIKEDEFKSGYECKTCGGGGKIECRPCLGTGRNTLNPTMVCKVCHGTKVEDCFDCNGKGGLIVVPDASQRRPTTGVIVSAGELCKVLKVGETVMYSNFAGYAVDLNRAGQPVCLRILHETEVLCRVSGHLELRTMRNQTEVTSI